jgi:glucose/mannose-6-phosphate isomerase
LRDLDDLDVLEELDSIDVLGAMESFPAQCREGWAIGAAATGLPGADRVDSVVVLGMGGSGAAGDVVQAVVEPRLPVPFRVVKSSGPMPEWVGRNTIVIAVSYSGDTRETLDAVSDAHDRGARMITISSGGKLADLSRGLGSAHIAVPGGLQPRAALGYLALPALAALAGVGLIPDPSDDVAETVEILGDIAGRCHRKHSIDGNPAKSLAQRLSGKVPIVYGVAGIGATAARRFKCDLNESGKTLAFWNELPELVHNEIVAWSNPTKDFVVVMIVDAADDESMIERWRITRSLIEHAVDDVVEVRTEGESQLARLMSIVLLGQFTSVYVALASGSDPGIVPMIDAVKTRLADFQGEGKGQ